MPQVEVEYWDIVEESRVSETGFRYRSSQTKLMKTETWEGTGEEIFKRFDAANNRLRYCNGTYWKFKEKEMQEKYIAWYKSLDKNTQFNMYYGNGIVD